MITVEIKMKNYGQILKCLQPKLQKYLAIWSREFGKDVSDIEETAYTCLYEAIQKFKTDLGTCQFETYFITFIRNVLINEARDTHAHKVTYEHYSNPCDICENNTLPCLSKCAKFKKYRIGKLCRNVFNNTPDTDIVRISAERDHNSTLLKLLMFTRPDYKELIERITLELEAGYTEKVAVTRTIQSIAKEKNISYSFIYEKFNKMRKLLNKYNRDILNV